MLLSVEDQITLRVLDEERTTVEKSIEQQLDKKARLECHVQLMKQQLVELMKQ
jgi:hypothetical protein